MQRKELHQHWRQQDQYVQNLQRELSQQIDELSEQVDDRLTAVPECLRQHDGASYKKARPAFLQTVDSTPFLVFQYHTRCLRQMHGTGTDLGTFPGVETHRGTTSCPQIDEPELQGGTQETTDVHL